MTDDYDRAGVGLAVSRREDFEYLVVLDAAHYADSSVVADGALNPGSLAGTRHVFRLQGGGSGQAYFEPAADGWVVLVLSALATAAGARATLARPRSRQHWCSAVDRGFRSTLSEHSRTCSSSLSAPFDIGRSRLLRDEERRRLV